MADVIATFPGLDDADLAVLGALGTRRAVAAGEYLYRQGDATYEFHVVLSGAVDIVVGSGADERVIARHGSGRFLGELNLLTGQRVFVSARVAAAGEVLVVVAAALRRVIATQPRLSDTILSAFIARLLSGAASSIRVMSAELGFLGSEVPVCSTENRHVPARGVEEL